MSVERDLSGTVVDGRYRVETRLGVGGMGAVWRVRHVQSLQRYALKTLHARASRDRLSVDRFLREARAAAALQSKHVVKIVDANVTHVDPVSGDPMPFIVMELLRGSTLEAVISWYGPLPPAQVLWLMEQVGRALDLAHGQGIVHRDLKPENVFVAVDEDGRTIAKVCDFGIAKMRGSSADLVATGAMKTEAGSTIGTPMYMAPEQARNSAEAVVESDQWSIALMVHRALSSREYFSGALSTADLLLKIVNDPLEAPSSRAGPFDEAFDAWFLRSCDRAPANRWPSVGAQIAALGEALRVTARDPIAIVPDDATIAAAPTMRADSDDPVGTGAPSARTGSAELEGEPSRDATQRRTTALVATAAVFGLAGLFMLRYGEHRPTGTPSSTSIANAPMPNTPMPSAPIASAPVATSAFAMPTPVAIVSPSGSISAATSSIASAMSSPKPSPKKPVHAPLPTPIETATAAAISAAPPPPSAKPATKLGHGGACERGVDCASGICAAYTCQ